MILHDLETLPASLDDVVAQYNGNGFYVDGNGELQKNDAAGLDRGSLRDVEVTNSDFLDDETLPFYAVEAVEIEVVPYSGASVLSAVDISNFGLTYTLRINGNDYRAHFPADSTLEVVDGALVNVGDSNVVGLLTLDGSSDLHSWQSQYLTVAPIYSTSGNNNAYRYGSRAYITTYSAGTNSQLQSEQVYVRPEVLERPLVGSGLSAFQVAAIGMLFLLVLFNMLGGIMRR